MPGRILVVDDIATNRLIARAKLTANYYDVIEAEDGERAIELAVREQPDLILLDVMMPGIDGFETCRRLKAGSATAHIPVVMLTALDQRSDRLRGLDAGADDFLSRPYPDMALLTRVSSLVRMKTMIDELRMRHETSRSLGLAAATPVGDEDLSGASVLLCGRRLDDAAAMIRERLGCAVAVTTDEETARSAMEARRFDACAIGPGLETGDPLRLASFLRNRQSLRDTAVVMVFPADDLARAHLALEMGVADYLTDPPDPAELTARLRTQIRRKRYSDRLHSTLHETLLLAVTDPLTGLYNRRYADNHLAALVARHQFGRHSLAAMALDLDRFKGINDVHGHAAGDCVLREFARRLGDNVRGMDLVARIGGEEFLVVMPDILPAHARRVAERVRAAVEDMPFRVGDGGPYLPVTVSVGLAFLRPGETGAGLIERADGALYASKNSGRNMVTLAEAA